MGDYYISVRKTGLSPSEWEWRILRRSNLISVRLGGKGFATESAARRQEAVALKKLLADLAASEGTTENSRQETGRFGE